MRNGIGVTTHALPDTGADGNTFIDNDFGDKSHARLNVKIYKLPNEIPVLGFDGRSAKPITRLMVANVDVDGHLQTRLPMLMVDIGKHDLILGRRFFEDNDVLIDCRRRRLVWPQEPLYTAQKNLVIPRDQLDQPPDPVAQQDAERRDRLMELQPVWKPRTIIKRPQSTRITERPIEAKPSPLVAIKPLDIAILNVASFRTSMKTPECEVFYASAREISRIIYERKHPKEPAPEETEEELIKRTLPKQWHDLIDCFTKKESDKLAPHRPYDHQILLEKPNNLPLSPLYKHTTEELETLKAWIDENLKKGWIAPSYASFGAPILFIRKSTGALRLCVDYRKLNAITRKDGYPLPRIDETFERLTKAKMFTKLDIIAAFNRIRMHPDSEELTSFRTRYGQFQTRVMPFGLTGGPATWQRFINDLLREYLDDFCTAYLDDIIIYSEKEEDHEEHVRKIICKLGEAGLTIDIKKCEFQVSRVKFLGYYVSTDGVEVDPEKIAVITEWAQPTTVRGVRGFLGFCGFYRKFIKDYGRLVRPLERLTHKDTAFSWTAECEEAFQKVKKALTSTTILRHYRPTLETKIETDASDGVTGGVLSQQSQETKVWHPVAFFSKAMSPQEMNYEIHDKEMLAIMNAFNQWRVELQSVQTPTEVYSDHRALEYFMTTKKLTPRQARWAEYLSQFNFEIQYRTGKSNSLADALTRRDQGLQLQKEQADKNRTQTFLPFSKLSKMVQNDVTSRGVVIAPVEPALQHMAEELTLIDQILASNRNDPSIEELRVKARTEREPTWTLEDGLLLRNGRLWVTEGTYKGKPLRTLIIKEAHEQVLTAHPGRTKTIKLLKDRYDWPGLGTDVDRYIRNCPCKRAHVPRDRTPGLLQPLPIPERPWQHISMDFKSCPPSRKGFDAVLVIVDRLGKRPISIPCHKTTTARDLAKLFIANVYRYYGPPETIVSDRGPQFISDFWDEVCHILGIKLKLSSADHPQTDGQTEIVNQYLDQRLRPFVNYFQDNWDELLPMMDFAQACLMHEATGQSAFMTELGYEPRMSFDWREIKAEKPKEKLNRTEAKAWMDRLHGAWEFAQYGMGLAQERYRVQANKHRREVDFDVGDWVHVTMKPWKSDRPSKKLSNPLSKPYRIIAKHGHAFELDLPKSIRARSILNPERLRKAAMDPLPGQEYDDPEPEEVDGELEYEVEKILGVREVRGKLKYRVSWAGWDEDPDEYSPENFRNAPLALKKFHEEYPDLPGPPKNLGYWLKCAEEDVIAESRRDDNDA